MNLHLYEAIEYAMNEGSVTISMLQRKLRIGYPKAARIIDHLSSIELLTQSEADKRYFTIAKSFECAWCKQSPSSEPDDYTMDMIYLGGFDTDDMPICDGCYGDSLSVSDDDELRLLTPVCS